MVTKPVMRICWLYGSSVLAKIHMVTKLNSSSDVPAQCSVLAKIHMVTKLIVRVVSSSWRSVLAKIHMVTKLLN